MLDEPTNHLDIHSVELLVESLNKYEGTIIFVSHDRYFISKAANKIWEIVDGHIKEFKGNYTEWVEWNERMAAKNGAPPKQEKAAAPPPKAPPAEVKPAISKEAKKELQRQQKLFQQCEEKVAQLKEEKKRLEADLASPAVYSDKQSYTSTESRYKKVESELAMANKEYEQAFEKMMELENNAAQTS